MYCGFDPNGTYCTYGQEFSESQLVEMKFVAITCGPRPFRHPSPKKKKKKKKKISLAHSLISLAISQIVIMFQQMNNNLDGHRLNEKLALEIQDESDSNPVVNAAEWAFKKTNITQINEKGVSIAARQILRKLKAESYTPRTWRTHSLHLLPVEPYIAAHPSNKAVLNWIFLISALNFSFWSSREGHPDRYAVEWQAGWNEPTTNRTLWTGYWSLVAALNRALQDDDIPITDPYFYSSETLCPDSLIAHVFRPAKQCSETIPLLQERINIMRESFGGSYQGLLEEFQRRFNGQGTALDLVKMVTDTFPSFRDETFYEGNKICFWKRAQILVAETWAAFYPDPKLTNTHPLFPGARGPAIQDLTMFADYRVPQILHHLKILEYPPTLIHKLRAGTTLIPGSKEEISLRAGSIVAVERVREAIMKLMEDAKGNDTEYAGIISSVVIDFFLWDLAKKLERGEDRIDILETADIIPAHRTRSIWY
ncbi:hypothetical protein D9757_007046 [Collybiopsis confluens]|uniref:Queuosine 5'-phosphate N-glycosylase/hydrolase n=1 Tax=Collybiopsis confluens TaxID=2823264 RepID=A0A8H5M4R0_9AGAR|nr:hypothetical protein D9757_007046 [Collybiopsis confluens]